MCSGTHRSIPHFRLDAYTDEWVACLRELGAACKTLGRRDEQVCAFKLAVRLEQIAASGTGRNAPA